MLYPNLCVQHLPSFRKSEISLKHSMYITYYLRRGRNSHWSFRWWLFPLVSDPQNLGVIESKHTFRSIIYGDKVGGWLSKGVSTGRILCLCRPYTMMEECDAVNRSIDRNYRSNGGLTRSKLDISESSVHQKSQPSESTSYVKSAGKTDRRY